MVTATQIYLDSNLLYAIKAANLDTTITASAGTHTLVVKSWDSSGRSFFKSMTLNVTNQQPVAALSVSATSMLVGTSVTASTSGSFDPDGTIVSSRIDFGDGTVVAAVSASHQYKSAGSYTLTAAVTDNTGAASTMSKTVTVNPQFVTIASPTFTSTTSSSINVSGTGFSGYGVTAMQVYLDGSLKAQVSASTINTAVSLAKGTHTLTVQGWDKSGAVFKKSMSVTRN
jgi:PKD repeat protein